MLAGLPTVLDLLVHAELSGRDAGTEDTGGADVHAVESQAAEGALQFVKRQAGVEERAERHIAGDAGKTIEIQDP